MKLAPEWVLIQVNFDPMQSQFDQVEDGHLEQVCKFAGKLVFRSDVIGRCGCTHKSRNVQNTIGERLEWKAWTLL